ncbi:MAG: hypothetical protein WBP11_02965 [Dokdonella sp.]
MCNFKFHTLCAIFCLPFAAALSPAIASDRDTILIVVSGEGRDQGKTRPGHEFDELSQAWLIFRDNGLKVEVASPQDGAIEPEWHRRKQ